MAELDEVGKTSLNSATNPLYLLGKPHFGFHAIGYPYYAPKGVSRGVVDQRWCFIHPKMAPSF